MSQSTIFALSSGQPPAGVAVIRLSGPRSFDAASSLIGSLPDARVAALRTIRNRNDDVIDQGLVLLFPAPNSFTGEDCVELQVHGSRAVVAAIEELLLTEGLRRAEAGEFARRAFEHGRLDLVEVEGLSELVNAETEMQRRLAIQSGMGALSARYDAWAERLTYARAMIEAELDFADEDDVPGSVSEQIAADLSALQGEMAVLAASIKSAEIIRDGFKVAIVGAPNAGKSSLLNAMARREIAIVTDVAGTTRDVITAELDLDGYLVRLFDTAGIREVDDIVEREGIRRARLAADEADLVLLLAPADMPAVEGVEDWSNIIRVATKIDMGQPASGTDDIRVSSHSGEGLDELRALLLEKARSATASQFHAGNRRHMEHIDAASKFVADAVKEPRLELKADALRAAGNELGRITGRVDVEDLLDVIFSKFCIGK